MNYYRRYMGDYQSKTAALSLAEHGAYNVLLDTCYSTELPLPAELDGLCRICRAMTKVEQDAVKSVANKFFPVGEDGLRHNRRADDEIAKAQATILKQRESGVDSANKRWGKDGSPDGSTYNSTDGSSIQPPTSNLQPLKANPQPSTAIQVQPPSDAPASRPRSARKKPDGAKTGPCWHAYSEAYAERWHTKPLPNAKVNGMLASFLSRVPVEEAPAIAAFYVQHNRGLYVSSKHCVDLMLRDAEGLRTEWVTNRTVTDTEARQADRTQANGNVFGKLIEEADRGH